MVDRVAAIIFNQMQELQVRAAKTGDTLSESVMSLYNQVFVGSERSGLRRHVERLMAASLACELNRGDATRKFVDLAQRSAARDGDIGALIATPVG